MDLRASTAHGRAQLSQNYVWMLDATAPVKRNAGRRRAVRIPGKDRDLHVGIAVNQLVHYRCENRLLRNRCDENVDRETINLLRWAEESGQLKNNLPVGLRLCKSTYVEDPAVGTPIGPGYYKTSLGGSAGSFGRDRNVLK